MKQTTREDYEKRIARVVAAIEQDPSAPHRLADLADLANFSPFHFHRIYCAMRGESVFDTIRRARLRRAAFDIASSRRKIIEIAQDAGFESAQSFSRAFRALVSVSPTAFRRAGGTFAEFVAGHRSKQQEQSMEVEIIDRAQLSVHALRYEGNVANIGEVWRKLWRWAAERGFIGDIEFAVGVCRDAPDAQGNVVYHAGLALRRAAAASDGVETVTVPGGRYASCRHIGPYAGIGRSFQRLYGDWLPASGFEADDRPTLELYRNNPYDTPAEELVTDLLIPLK